jgi:hypothetical protein
MCRSFVDNEMQNAKHFTILTQTRINFTTAIETKFLMEMRVSIHFSGLSIVRSIDLSSIIM